MGTARKRRIDTNQPEIVKTFRALGYTVAHTHMVGDGFPDIVVSRFGRTKLVEIKDGKKPPSKRALTPDEKEFHESWQDEILIIESVEDVLNYSTRVNG